jgi:hypothetical protein
MRKTLVWAAGSLALLTACSDALTVDDLAGSYSATTFTTQEGSATTDWLTGGASIHVTLSAAGNTSGRLFVPGGNEDGSDLDADLTGTWALAGSQVTFQHSADTFLRDMPFTVDAGRLIGEATFSGVTVRVVLERD